MDLPSVSQVWLGAAGAGHSSIQERIRQWVAHRGWSRQVHVATDAENVLWTAGPGPAVGLVAGTGSMAIARDGSSKLRRAGGWGPLLGDEGGGYWAAIRALQEVLHARDAGAPRPPLADALFAVFGVTTEWELPAAVHAASRSRIASCAHPIGAAAARGDVLAQRIVVEAAGHLAKLTATVAPPQAKAECTLVLAGGWLLGCPGLTERVQRDAAGLHHFRPRRTLLAPEPVMGAIQGALHYAQFLS